MKSRRQRSTASRLRRRDMRPPRPAATVIHLLCHLTVGRRRGDLSNAEWAIIGMLLPPEHGRKARPAHDNRRFFDGMLYVLRVGCPWRDMHERYGPSGTRSTCASAAGPSRGSGTRCSRRLWSLG